MTSDSRQTRPASGDQLVLAAHGYRAEIATVGATLRGLTHDGRPLVAGFDADAVRPVYRGAVLVPWPNRVGNGRYAFGGIEHQLALTEPDRGNALHGLVAWADFAVLDATDARITLRHRLVPQQGYPFDLLVEVTYALSPEGLAWSVRTTNVGAAAAPYGTGPHPYLVAGEGTVDDWLLTLPAGQVLEVDADTLLPLRRSAVEDVESGRYDFRAGRAIGTVFIDHALTSLTADAVVTLLAADGTGVGMRWDAAVLPWVQVHTADRPEPELNRAGLAVEPMTCPPDAFTTGDDLVVLAPGDVHEASWTIFAV